MQILREIISGQAKKLSLFCCIFFISAQISTREYQVKAAFLFNFTQFVDWPESSFSGPQSPLVIGILGADPFGNYLHDLIAGEKINQHPLEIKHFSNADEIGHCHILFINVADKKSIQAVIEKLKGKAILTVGDAHRFSRFGGMIGLYPKDDKVNIEVNLDAVKEGNLTISSKLLKLSKIVSTDKK
jgi:hypothetical protein